MKVQSIMTYVDVLYLKSKDIYDEFYIMFEYKLQPGIFEYKPNPGYLFVERQTIDRNSCVFKLNLQSGCFFSTAIGRVNI